MAKFNQKPTIKLALENDPAATLNYEGGLAFSVDAKTNLFLQVASSLGGEALFYKSGAEAHDDLVRAIHNVAAVDPAFVLKLAHYARTQLYLRSVPMVLLAEYANSSAVGKVPNARKWVSSTISRVDDMTELISYQLARGRGAPGKQKIPFVLKRGVADAFPKFDTYELAKYNRPGTVKLVDVLRLTRPKPRSEKESERYHHLRKGTLPVPETWETVISAKGSTKEAWEEVLPKMGYMALLRNLRNLLRVGVNIDPVVTKITDEKAILRSKQFPFRFFSAYRALEKYANEPMVRSADLGYIMKGVAKALETSIRNVPKLSGTSFVMIDVSGSMDSPISQKSSVLRSDIATLFGAMMDRLCDRTTCSIFGSNHMIIPLGSGNILEDKKKLVNDNRVGHSTNGWLPIQWAIENNQKFDRFILFSDMQCYDTRGYGNSTAAAYTQYQRQINPGTYLYSVDLSGHGTIEFPQKTERLSLVAGFSERIFDFISLFESDKITMMDHINNISLPGGET